MTFPWEEFISDTTPDAQALEDIAKLANRALALEKEIATQEEYLKGLNKAYHAIVGAPYVEGTLVSTMEEAGVTQFTTVNGLSISIKEELTASVPKENKPRCIAWLVAHQQSDVVSCNLTLSYKKGEREEATELAKELAERGLQPTVNEDFNTSTVKSVLTELLKQGEQVPLDLFGAQMQKRAKIKGSS